MIDVCEVEEQEEDDEGDNETILVPVVGFLFRCESLTGDKAKLSVLMMMLFVGFGDCVGDGTRLDKY